MQSVAFGIMGGHIVFMIGFSFKKSKLENHVVKDTFLP